MALQIINIYHKEYPVDIKNQGRQTFQKILAQLYLNDNGVLNTWDCKPKRGMELNPQVLFPQSSLQITQAKLELNLRIKDFRTASVWYKYPMYSIHFCFTPRRQSINSSKGMRP